MAQLWRDNREIRPTREEWAQIRTERLKCQRAAAVLAECESVYEFFARPGSDYVVSVHKRDLRGNLLISITCYGQGLTKPYRRRIRLVRETRLKLA